MTKRPAANPTRAQKIPMKVAARSGFTEKAVKPLIQSPSKPAMV